MHEIALALSRAFFLVLRFSVGRTENQRTMFVLGMRVFFQ